MTFLRNQLAWVLLSVFLSGVWWLMTHTDGAHGAPAAAPRASADATLGLSTPVTLTLTGGEVIRGVITGAEAICPSWQATLAAGNLSVTLPDGRRVPGSAVQDITSSPATLGGLAELVTTTACGSALTVHAVTP